MFQRRTRVPLSRHHIPPEIECIDPVKHSAAKISQATHRCTLFKVGISKTNAKPFNDCARCQSRPVHLL